MPQSDPKDPDDPKGLIHESFRIDGITDPECRSILTDWALSLDATQDALGALARLHARHKATAPDHPMTLLLLEATSADIGEARRRGGRAGRMDALRTGRS